MNECLKNAQQCLHIQAVNLKESNIFVRDNVDLSVFDREESKIQSFRSVDRVREISFTNTDDEEIWDYRFNYSVGTRLILSDEDEISKQEDYEPVIEITATFEAKYLSQHQLKEDEFKAYSIDNVGYHVWPYWREYVQSSCARIGFSPAFEIPVYIISQKEKKSEQH